MNPLSHKEITAHLETLPEWEHTDASISKTFLFPDFAHGLSFVNTVGERAETHNHHPSLELSWGSVVVRLSTHDAGGVTEKDIMLAREIEAIGTPKEV